MVVARGIRQAGMELVGLGGVMPQRADGVGQREVRLGSDRLADFMPVDGGLGGEPWRVADQVHREWDEQ